MTYDGDVATQAARDAAEFKELCETIRAASNKLRSFTATFHTIEGDTLFNHLLVFRNEVGNAAGAEGEAVLKEVDSVIERLRRLGHYSPQSPSWARTAFRDFARYSDINFSSGTSQLFAIIPRDALATFTAGARLLEHLDAAGVVSETIAFASHSFSASVPDSRERAALSVRAAVNAEGYFGADEVIAATRRYEQAIEVNEAEAERIRVERERQEQEAANADVDRFIASCGKASPERLQRAQEVFFQTQTVGAGT